MPTNTTLTQQPRPTKRSRTTPASAGLPDPRPVTDYDVTYDEYEGNSRLTVALKQPCVIREPMWGCINCETGQSVLPVLAKSFGNDTIVFTFDGIIDRTVAFVDVPYQDMQVQNFQGGFVRPGGKWFRAVE